MFIMNPVAGKKKIKNSAIDLIRLFDNAGFEVTACCTQKDFNAQKIVESRAQGYDLIVCCGGDGTLKETICGVMALGTDIPIGFIPLGTTNDFAFSLGVPTDPIRAAQAIIDGEPKPFDMGISGSGDKFIYVAAFGNFTDLSYSTSQKLKNRLGLLAYYLGTAKAVFKLHGYPAKITTDSGDVFEGRYFYVSMSNSLSVAGMHVLTDYGVDLADGRHELIMIEMPNNIFKFLKFLFTTLGTLATKDIGANKYINVKRVQNVKFAFPEPTPFTFDGEFGGAHTEIETKNLYHEVNIILHK